MNRKGLIAIAVSIGILLLGTVAALVFFLTTSTRIDRSQYLVIRPPGNYHSIPAGKYFEIVCEVVGGTPSHIKWLDPDGYEITVRGNGTTSTVRTGPDSLSLKFYNPTADESGIYKCSSGGLRTTVMINFHGKEPRFQKDYEYIWTSEGAYLKVTCDATGDEPIKYQWYNPLNYRIREVSREGEAFTSANGSILNIPHPKAEDSGLYNCTAENLDGFAKKTFEIFIRSDGAPKFDVDNEVVNGYKDSELVLHCFATGSKPMTYEWYNPKNERVSQESHHSIESMQEYQKGLYRCVARNDFGTAEKTFRVTFSTDGSPRFDVDYAVVNVSRGSEFDLRCEPKGAKPMTYTWYDQNEMEVSAGSSPLIHITSNPFGSVLTVTYAQENHTGDYTCIAKNKWGTSNMIFEVYIQENYGVPRFSSSYENVTVQEHSSLELFCCADNDDGMTNYTWYDKDEKSVAYNNQASPLYASGTRKGSFLTINAVSSNHSGLYECKAENMFGLASMLFNVAVSPVPESSIPSFDNDYFHSLAEQNSRLALSCKATGEGPITYEWYNKFVDLIPSDPESPVYASIEGDASVLVIKKVQKTDSGTYTCKAHNKNGSMSKIFDISVFTSQGNDTDITSIRHVETRNVTTRSVLFAIATSGEEDAVEGRYKEKQDEEERTISFNKGDDYEVKDLVPGGLYSFQFRTVSSTTNGAWSGSYNVTLLPDRPEVIIRNVQPDKLEIEWFRTIDEIFRGTLTKYEISYYTIQIQQGNYWQPSDCAATIVLPSCRGSRYTITGLSRQVYYELNVRAFTASGPGEPYKHKFYML